MLITLYAILQSNALAYLKIQIQYLDPLTISVTACLCLFLWLKRQNPCKLKALSHWQVFHDYDLNFVGRLLLSH